jgi:hypothetical protein
MEWLWVVGLFGLIFAPVIWAMVSRLRRGDKGDEAYNGSSSDAALMEMGRDLGGRIQRQSGPRG